VPPPFSLRHWAKREGKGGQGEGRAKGITRESTPHGIFPLTELSAERLGRARGHDRVELDLLGGNDVVGKLPLCAFPALSLSLFHPESGDPHTNSSRCQFPDPVRFWVGMMSPAISLISDLSCSAWPPAHVRFMGAHVDPLRCRSIHTSIKSIKFHQISSMKTPSRTTPNRCFVRGRLANTIDERENRRTRGQTAAQKSCIRQKRLSGANAQERNPRQDKMRGNACCYHKRSASSDSKAIGAS
jgi:hypothetical protein